MVMAGRGGRDGAGNGVVVGWASERKGSGQALPQAARLKPRLSNSHIFLGL